MGRRTIGPVSSGLRESWAGRDVLVTSLTSDSCGGPGAVHADTVASCQVHGVSFDTLVRLASGLSGHCVKKQCGLVGLCFGGRTALDLRLSQVRMGVAVMGQDCNYQLDVMQLGNKKG